MRMLLAALTLALTFAAGPAQAQSPGSAPPAPEAHGPPGPAAPGILVTPALPRGRSSGQQGNPTTGEPPVDGTPDQGGGCQYVPRKLDLIV